MSNQSRVYVTGGNPAQVAVVNPVTLAVTSLPNPYITNWTGTAIAGSGDGDIWVGFGDYTTATYYTKPRLAHWDGLTWTNYELSFFSAHPDWRGYRVNSILYVNSSEVYAAITKEGHSAGYVVKWNGSTWSLYIGAFAAPNRLIIMPGSTGSDMWITGVQISNSDVAHWSGSSFDELYDFGSITPGGICLHGGRAHFAVSNNGEVYRRDAAGTWNLALDVGYSAQCANYNNCLWSDPNSDQLYSSALIGGVNDWGIASWPPLVTDNSSNPRYSEQISGIGGVSLSRTVSHLWIGYNTTNYVSKLDLATGAWTDVNVGFVPEAFLLFQDPDAAPYLANRSPAPNSQYNHPDVPVSLSIVDDIGNLTLSSVRIYLNDTLAWKGGTRLPGVTGDIDAVELPDGFSFGLTPREIFELGEQTVRVVASDANSNALDETYSFWVGEAPSPSEEDELADRSVGIDLLLDGSHDVATADYDLQLVAGVDEVVQHLLVRLRLFLSEWYLDTESGVPYYRDVLVSNPKTRVIEGILRQQILGDEDIEALESFELEIDRVARELNLDFRAVSKIGPVEVSEITI